MTQLQNIYPVNDIESPPSQSSPQSPSQSPPQTSPISMNSMVLSTPEKKQQFIVCITALVLIITCIVFVLVYLSHLRKQAL